MDCSHSLLQVDDTGFATCIECGKGPIPDFSKSNSPYLLQRRGATGKVSYYIHESAVEKCGEQAVTNMLNNNKLMIIFDLDHTLIHCHHVCFARSIADFQQALQKPPPFHIQNFKEETGFLPWNLPHNKLHVCTIAEETHGVFIVKDVMHVVSVRPHVKNLFDQLKDLFTFRVFTAAQTEYAIHVCELINYVCGEEVLPPRLQDVVFTRSDMQNNIKAFDRILPKSKDVAVMVDDSPKVWEDLSKLLICPPYMYGKSDDYLLVFVQQMVYIHTEFFNRDMKCGVSNLVLEMFADFFEEHEIQTAACFSLDKKRWKSDTMADFLSMIEIDCLPRIEPGVQACIVSGENHPLAYDGFSAGIPVLRLNDVLLRRFLPLQPCNVLLRPIEQFIDDDSSEEPEIEADAPPSRTELTFYMTYQATKKVKEVAVVPHEGFFPAVFTPTEHRAKVESLGQLKKAVQDPHYHHVMTPDFEYGALGDAFFVTELMLTSFHSHTVEMPPNIRSLGLQMSFPTFEVFKKIINTRPQFPPARKTPLDRLMIFVECRYAGYFQSYMYGAWISLLMRCHKPMWVRTDAYIFATEIPERTTLFGGRLWLNGPLQNVKTLLLYNFDKFGTYDTSSVECLIFEQCAADHDDVVFRAMAKMDNIFPSTKILVLRGAAAFFSDNEHIKILDDFVDNHKHIAHICFSVRDLDRLQEMPPLYEYARRRFKDIRVEVSKGFNFEPI
ncbi:hypothetical protein PCE1_003821 [Barthelona sp. PCE]